MVISPLSVVPCVTTLMLQGPKVWAFLRIGKVLNCRWGTPGGEVQLDAYEVPQLPAEAAANSLKWMTGIEVRDLTRLIHIGTVPEVSDSGLFICSVHVLRLRKDEVPVNRRPVERTAFAAYTVDELARYDAALLPSLCFGLEYLRVHPEL
jgi:hypothetical protein